MLPYCLTLMHYATVLPNPYISLSRDRRGRGGAMSHKIDRLFPLLTIHRVGVEVVNCQACSVDCFSTMWYEVFLFPACHPTTPAG